MINFWVRNEPHDDWGRIGDVAIGLGRVNNDRQYQDADDSRWESAIHNHR